MTTVTLSLLLLLIVGAVYFAKYFRANYVSDPPPKQTNDTDLPAQITDPVLPGPPAPVPNPVPPTTPTTPATDPTPSIPSPPPAPPAVEWKAPSEIKLASGDWVPVTVSAAQWRVADGNTYYINTGSYIRGDGPATGDLEKDKITCAAHCLQDPDCGLALVNSRVNRCEKYRVPPIGKQMTVLGTTNAAIMIPEARWNSLYGK